MYQFCIKVLNKRIGKSQRHGKRSGFTLAEVLITLGVIGIVAECTIPTLVHDFNEQNYKVAYKKAFSVASQAWAHAIDDNNIVSMPAIANSKYGQAKIDNFNAFKSYFKITIDCNNNNNSECWDPSGEKSWNNNYPTSDALAFVDASGMAWSLVANDSATGDNLLVDTNGLQKPNKYGYDRFILQPVPATFMNPPVYAWSSVSEQLPGFPQKIVPFFYDSTSTDNVSCPSGNTHPCYYTKWLYN